MTEYLARDLVHFDESTLWGMHNQDITIVYDDGDKQVIGIREVTYCWYCWEVHRKFPLLPLKRSHVMQKRLTPKTHTELLSKIIVDCHNVYQANNQMLDMDEINRLIYEITNTIYNVFVVKTQRYVKSLDIFDFIKVTKHPEVLRLMEELRKCNGQGEFTINKVNDAIIELLQNSPDFNGCGIPEALRSSLVSPEQAAQCVGVRGNPTDIDSNIFKKSILTNYSRGVRNITDLAQDSRTAAKSLFFTRDPMRKSEYFNRACQLSAATLKNLHYVDCGNKDYSLITIKSKKLLRDMVGIFHYCEVMKTERPITSGDKHLIGKTVQCRLVNTCKHPDRNGVCYKCYGELSLSIPYGTNIGHVAASDVQSRVAQLLLSNKHLDSSANLDKIYLSDYDKRFVVTGTQENGIYFNKVFTKKKFSIVLAEQETQGLDYVKVVATADQLVPYRLSELSYIQIVEHVGDGYGQPVEVCVSCDTRKSYLSRKMLRYVKAKGWTINEQGHYVIDMSDWDINEHFLELPLKHFSTVDYMQSIEGFIKGGITRDGDSIMNYDNFPAALMAFHDLVSAKLDCHVSHLQVIILSTMVQDIKNRDYRLPMPKNSGSSAFYNQQMTMRSLSAAMAYQNQAVVMYTPSSYLCTVRPPHPLDPLLVSRRF